MHMHVSAVHLIPANDVHYVHVVITALVRNSLTYDYSCASSKLLQVSKSPSAQGKFLARGEPCCVLLDMQYESMTLANLRAGREERAEELLEERDYL
jgi:hypothetical protein